MSWKTYRLSQSSLYINPIIRVLNVMMLSVKHRVYFSGRFDLRLPIWRCPSCGHMLEVSNADLMICGYFVASPVQMSTVVHEDVFVMWKELRFRSPGTSLRAFLRMLEKLGNSYGTVSVILKLGKPLKQVTSWSHRWFHYWYHNTEVLKYVGTSCPLIL